MGPRVLALALCAAAAMAREGLTIESLERTVDLRTAAEKVRQVVVLKNGGNAPQASFLVAIPTSRAANLSYVRVSAKKVPLKVVRSDEQGDNGESLYMATFPTPLAPGAKKKVNIYTGYVGVLVPSPPTAKQNAPHFVKYDGSLYATTPYTAKTQTTVVRLSTSKKLSYTETGPLAEADEKLTYGPFAGVEGYTSAPLSVHFETKASFATLTRLEREIKVCHWGGVVFSETYDLRHSGAQISDEFSRLEYEQLKRGASVSSFKAKLPVNAYGVDLRDDIGNISTSNVRESGEFTLLEMRPRFPLFGGWRTVFNLFYTVPIVDLVGQVAGTSEYVLNTTFSTPFEGVVVEKCVIRVVLPEGSSNIRWATPFEVDTVSTDLLKTYLDLTGRPVLVLETSNLMKFHNQNFQVVYSYPNVMIHRGPLFIIIGFMLFFGLVIVASRLDLSIGGQAGAQSSVTDAKKND